MELLNNYTNKALTNNAGDCGKLIATRDEVINILENNLHISGSKLLYVWHKKNIDV